MTMESELGAGYFRFWRRIDRCKRLYIWARTKARIYIVEYAEPLGAIELMLRSLRGAIGVARGSFRYAVM